MKVYGDLTIRGDEQALSGFIAALDQNLTGGWSRYREREGEVARAALGPMFCFVCSQRQRRPASELWIASHSNGYLYVSNILAQGHSSLTCDEYNSILADFDN